MAAKRPSIGVLRIVHETFEDCGSKRETARRLEMPESTVRGYLKYFVENYDSPISENAGKYHEDWTAQDCIDELRRIAQLDPEKGITRNYFRNNSEISEATWSRYFGTFLEYRRQAGIILSRAAHQMERQIAKHASLDKYRPLLMRRQSRKLWLKRTSQRSGLKSNKL